MKRELGTYSNKLQKIKNPDFDKIRNISVKYKNRINRKKSDKIFDSLDKGIKILSRKRELYMYMNSYGKSHKVKLDSSYKKILNKMDNKTIDVIDWGCGQALATMTLVDYIKRNKLDIKINKVILIEPSTRSLERALLHVDILAKKKIKTIAINKDFDKLKSKDLKIKNSNTTLHIFSNVLDIQNFKIDKKFIKKVLSYHNKKNYFICVSPNINDGRNARLDKFYQHFKDKFKTKLISERKSNVPNNLGKDYTRYEKVFKCNLDKFLGQELNPK